MTRVKTGRKLWYNAYMSIKYLVGIDEVGRGPLLGPVAVGIVVIEVKAYAALKQVAIFPVNKDSKKLSEKKRQFYFEKIKELKTNGILDYGVFFESNTVIDIYGIAGAIKMAIKKGLENIKGGPSLILVEECQLLLDGGLCAPEEYINQESIIKGDEKELVIALASIAAKVTRDNKLEELAGEIPYYDLKNNKGYGTPKHLSDLKKYGPCFYHRKKFISGLI